MTHGPLLSADVWTSLLKGSLLHMLRYSMDMYVQQKLGLNNQSSQVPFDMGLPTPSFSGLSQSTMGGGDKKKPGPPKKKMNFDDETVMKALQKNNDGHWEETCTLILNTVLRTIKKYIQLEQKR